MLAAFDRVKAGLVAFVTSCFPRIDYLARYSGTVIAQGGPNAFDFQPDSPNVPGVSGVPVRLGLPGVTLSLDLSSKPRALLGFMGGDPSQPFIDLWEAPGLQAISFSAGTINLGSTTPDDALALASLVLNALNAIATTFNTHIHAVATTGTATAQTGTAAPTLTPITAPGTVASNVVKSD